MRILILTRSAWDDSNSIGNTCSNFFKGYKKNNIANLFVRETYPNNNVCVNYYRISEKSIIKDIFSLSHSKTGYYFYYNKIEKLKNKDLIYNFFRKGQNIFALFFRELIWIIGTWKNNNLSHFLLDFQPDIIFSPCFSSFYMHDILWYIKNESGAKVILFHADDYLTDKSVGESLFDKIYGRNRQNKVRMSTLKADLNYCISEKQQIEYQKIVGKEMKLLYKGGDFNSKPMFKNYSNPELIRLVYVGSTLYGRWETLALLAQELNEINKTKKLFELLIYSQYQPTTDCLNAMIVEGTSKFMGAVAADKVNEVYKNSDIVLHVESFDENEKMKTRLSFSTKIVDCLHSERCVFAIGWEEAASISYLSDNNAALIANNKSDIKKVIKSITESPEIIEKYAQNAWHCGKKNHQIKDIQNNLYSDIQLLLNK